MTNPMLLSTIDNPFNPFTHFNEWFQFDCVYQYHSNELLAKFARTSDDLTDEENRQEVESAIDRLMGVDPTLNLCKIIQNDDGSYSKSFKQDGSIVTVEFK